MFIEKTIKGKRIYCSDILEIEHFFNSRDFMVKENLSFVADYFNLKAESHMLHLNSFVSLCINKCLFNFDFSSNFASQIEHIYFLLLCVNKCFW